MLVLLLLPRFEPLILDRRQQLEGRLARVRLGEVVVFRGAKGEEGRWKKSKVIVRLGGVEFVELRVVVVAAKDPVVARGQLELLVSLVETHEQIAELHARLHHAQALQRLQVGRGGLLR